MYCSSLFVPFRLAIVLSVLHRFTDSGCPFSNIKLFFYVIHVLIYPPQLEYNGDVIYLAHSPQVWLIVLIRRKSKYWFTGSHNEESEWSNIPTIGLLDNNMLF